MLIKKIVVKNVIKKVEKRFSLKQLNALKRNPETKNQNNSREFAYLQSFSW